LSDDIEEMNGMSVRSGALTVELSRSEVPPGGAVRVTVSGAPSRAAISVTVDGLTVGVGGVDAVGDGVLRALIPHDTGLGAGHHLAVRVDGTIRLSHELVVRTRATQEEFGPERQSFNPHENVLSAVDTTMLAESWSSALGAAATTSPVGGKSLFVGTTDAVVGVGAIDGRTLWRTAVAGGARKVAAGYGRVFVVTGSEGLVVLDARSGARQWGTAMVAEGDLVLAYRHVFVGDMTVRAYRVDGCGGSACAATRTFAPWFDGEKPPYSPTRPPRVAIGDGALFAATEGICDGCDRYSGRVATFELSACQGMQCQPRWKAKSSGGTLFRESRLAYVPGAAVLLASINPDGGTASRVEEFQSTTGASRLRAPGVESRSAWDGSHWFGPRFAYPSTAEAALWRDDATEVPVAVLDGPIRGLSATPGVLWVRTDNALTAVPSACTAPCDGARLLFSSPTLRSHAVINGAVYVTDGPTLRCLKGPSSP